MVDIRDLDQDGYLNIILADNDSHNRIVILEEDGNGHFSENFEIFDTTAPIRRVAVADCDGDDKPEILTANAKGQIKIWESLKDDLYIQTYEHDLGNTIENIIARDIDKDDRYEFLIPQESEPTRFHILSAQGDNQYTIATLYEGRKGNAMFVGARDLNQDGIVELVFADDNYDRSGGRIYVYQKDKLIYSDDQFAFNGRLSSKLSLGDTDGNGQGEIIGLDKITYNLRILEGTRNKDNFLSILNAPSDYEPAVIDIDQDGQAEFFSIKKNRFSEKKILTLGERRGNSIYEIFNSQELFENFDKDLNLLSLKMLLVKTAERESAQLVLQQGSFIHFLDIFSNSPPHISLEPNKKISLRDVKATSISATISDQDHDSVYVQWKEDTRILKPWSLLHSSGKVTLNLSEINPSLGDGLHRVTLEVRDPHRTLKKEMILIIGNAPAVVNASGSGIYKPGDDIKLNGYLSDLEGDTLNYRWVEGRATFFEGQVKTLRGGKPVSLPEHIFKGGLYEGLHHLTLIVEDPVTNKQITSSTIDIQVIDKTGMLALRPVADPALIWPPDGKMKDMVIHMNMSPSTKDMIIKANVQMINPPSTDQIDQPLNFTIPSIDSKKKTIKLQLRAGSIHDAQTREYAIEIQAINSQGYTVKTLTHVMAPINVIHQAP